MVLREDADQALYEAKGSGRDRIVMHCGDNVHNVPLRLKNGRMRPDAPMPRLCLHELRHTWATLALAAGVHPKVVKERLVHTPINTGCEDFSNRPRTGGSRRINP